MSNYLYDYKNKFKSLDNQSLFLYVNAKMDNEDIKISDEHKVGNEALDYFMDPKTSGPETNAWKDWPLTQKALQIGYRHHHKKPASRF